MRPRYLPAPAIEILRREIPGLPWESPSGADISTAEGWIASINKAVAQTPSGPHHLHPPSKRLVEDGARRHLAGW